MNKSDDVNRNRVNDTPCVTRDAPDPPQRVWTLPRTSLASTCALAVALGLHGPASAQQQPDDAELAPLEEITVTGSRIRRSGMVTPTPVTSIEMNEIAQYTSGNMVDLFESLPQFMTNVNVSSGTTNSPGPAAQGPNINLRSLGVNRTLVLMDGRRLVPNNKAGAPNVALLPAGAIRNIEVVTGGASAAYGTDAVAGVVNFMLDTEFTGLRGNIESGVSARGDAQNNRVRMTYGTSLGERSHLILSGELRGEAGIRDASSRSWTGLGVMPNPAGGQPVRVHAREIYDRRWTCGGLIDAPGTSINRLEFNPDGSTTPFVDSSFVGGNMQSTATEFGGGSGPCDPHLENQPGTGPNFTNDQRLRSFFGYLDFDVTDDFKVFTQTTVGSDIMVSDGASNAIRSPWQAIIFRENAFLPDHIRQAMIDEDIDTFNLQRTGRDLIAHGRSRFQNDTFGVLAGFEMDVRGGFFDGWNVRGHYQYGQNDQEITLIGHLRQQTLHIATDAVVDPETGRTVCYAAMVNPETFGDCVPLNLFGEGRASPAAISYVTTPLRGQRPIVHAYDTDLNDAELMATGQLFEGWGAGPIDGAFGVSYRRETISSRLRGVPEIQTLDPPTPANEADGGPVGLRAIPSGIASDLDLQLFQSFGPVDGGFHVWEIFAETFVPLGGNVNASLGARWAEYEGSGTQWAYKAGLDWQVTDDFRLRGTFSRDVRAASLGERFDFRSTGSTVDDPATGELDWLFSQRQGGNPEANPEEADTFTVGFVYQPSAVPGLGISVDWWQIDVAGALGLLGTQRIVDECHFNQIQLACDLITRDANGFITEVFNVFTNINREEASGLDVEVSYRTDVNLFGGSPESLDIRWFGSWLNERSTTLPDAPKVDTVGQLPRGGDHRTPARPEYTFTLNGTYRNGPWSTSLQQRYIHSGVLDINWVTGVDIDDNRVPATWYTNLRLGYTLDRPNGSWDFYGQVINLFDQAPPHRGMSHQYDIKGQRFVAGARFEF